MSEAAPGPGRVVVIGSANMDIIGRVPRLPQPGETVLGESLHHAPGGKGANQAVAAARAGSQTIFVGKVGTDNYGDALRESLRSAGASVESLGEVADISSGVALILVDQDGANSIAVIPGANSKVTPRDVDRLSSQIAAYDVVVLQLEIPIETVEHAARAARRAGARVVLNPAPARSLSPDLLAHCDVLVPNRSELQQLSGVADPARGARALLRSDVGAVIVTLGADGALIVTADDEIVVPAFRTRAVDTTGAGDAFVGNLAHGLVQNQSLEQAARFAAAAAAMSVQRHGAQPSMPTRIETEQLLQTVDA